MPHFTFVARSADGKTVSEAIHAATIHEARSTIDGRGLELVELKEISRPPTPAWIVSDEEIAAAVPSKASDPVYFPLLTTFRLYAGWLLAWYFAIFALGGYQLTHQGSFSIPFVADLLDSPMIAECSFAVFLFLALSSLHRTFKSGMVMALFLSLAGITAFTLFSINL